MSNIDIEVSKIFEGCNIIKCTDYHYKILLVDAEFNTKLGISFWPTRGKWISLSTPLTKGVGQHSAIEYLKELSKASVIKDVIKATTPIKRIQGRATVSDLIKYLDELKDNWSIEDEKYLGKFEDQPICVDSEEGMHTSIVINYEVEFGLVFDTYS